MDFELTCEDDLLRGKSQKKKEYCKLLPKKEYKKVGYDFIANVTHAQL